MKAFLITIAILTIGFIMANCRNTEYSNLDMEYNSHMTQSSFWLNRYLFACEYEDGNIISLSDSTMLLDSAMWYANKANSLKSSAVAPYLRRLGVLYLKQEYDSVLYHCNHDSLSKRTFSSLTYEEYPLVLNNRTKARIKEKLGDTASRNQFISRNVVILEKYVSGTSVEDLMLKVSNEYDIFKHGETVAIIEYFYYLSITNYELAISKIAEFERKYPDQPILLLKIKETIKQPLFWAPML